MLKYITLMSLIVGLFQTTPPSKAAKVTEITGAGSTFAYPLYTKWAEAYEKETHIKLNYQPIGSGGGIRHAKDRAVDFGASDKPLEPKALQPDLFQFPTAISGVVVVHNLKGKLKLTGEVLADIYLGKITKWNDPKIQQLNENMELPNKDITVVYRSDASGTTFIFTSYLSKVNKDWNVGASTVVSWHVGVGGKGNEGIAAFMNTIEGAIGYVEYGYAKRNALPAIELKNKNGTYVTPNLDTFKAAAGQAKLEEPKNFYVVLTDLPGKDSWPITGATYILLHETQSDPEIGRAVLKFFDWCFTNGNKMATESYYMPLPESLKKLIRKAWARDVQDKEGNPIWKENVSSLL